IGGAVTVPAGRPWTTGGMLANGSQVPPSLAGRALPSPRKDSLGRTTESGLDNGTGYHSASGTPVATKHGEATAALGLRVSGASGVELDLAFTGD
ncbi:MAG: hypothetical protein O7E49_04575, partial [Gemmatimonadetes bacterium]|nr:hypothetical protein [Gemmatimonadota bacterium]